MKALEIIVPILIGGLTVGAIGHFFGQNIAIAVVGGWALLGATR